MTDRPIIFSAPMVRALLDGRKTQTRRLAKFVQTDGDGWHIRGGGGGMIGADDDAVLVNASDYAPYAAGDRLYVREAFRLFADIGDDSEVTYLADGQRFQTGPCTGDIRDAALPSYFKMIDSVRRRSKDAGFVAVGYPSIYMPRWASRLTLIVTNVRVERLNAIRETDAIAEGAREVPVGAPPGIPDLIGYHHGQVIDPPEDCFLSATASFRHLWKSLHGNEAWEANPFVVAVSFRVERGNIDQIGSVAA